MVYVVVLKGLPVIVTAGVTTCRQISNGFSAVTSPQPGLPLGLRTEVVVIQSEHTVEVLRNFLIRSRGLEVLVMQLSGAWASQGLNEVVQWLQGAQLFF